MVGALLAGEARVVWLCRDSRVLQMLGDALCCIAACTVHNAAFLRMAAGEGKRLLQRLGLGEDTVGEVGPVEAGNVAMRVTQPENLHDVLTNTFRGGGGEGHQGQMGKEGAKLRKLAVLWAEVVAPVADAMGFVNGNEDGVPCPYVAQEAREHEPLWRNVEEAVLAIVEVSQAGAGLVRG